MVNDIKSNATNVIQVTVIGFMITSKKPNDSDITNQINEAPHTAPNVI